MILRLPSGGTGRFNGMLGCCLDVDPTGAKILRHRFGFPTVALKRKFAVFKEKGEPADDTAGPSDEKRLVAKYCNVKAFE
ncbi:MAG: hypothetical protein P8Z37_18985 [Acidobacteriota bacterium]